LNTEFFNLIPDGVQNVIFDLDGTLIDSAPGIVSSCEHAFETCNLVPINPIDLSIVGPPLRETMIRLLGRDDDKQVTDLIEKFKEHYDSEGLKFTTPFPQVEEMLDFLDRSKRLLYIVTNKRQKPTQAILEQLNWTRFFRNVYSIDTFGEMIGSKPELLNRLICDAGLDRLDCIYVGDRTEDSEAAVKNQIKFIQAVWDSNI
jgi:phosphoglycolate phosphatase